MRYEYISFWFCEHGVLIWTQHWSLGNTRFRSCCRRASIIDSNSLLFVCEVKFEPTQNIWVNTIWIFILLMRISWSMTSRAVDKSIMIRTTRLFLSRAPVILFWIRTSAPRRSVISYKCPKGSWRRCNDYSVASRWTVPNALRGMAYSIWEDSFSLYC